MKKRVIISLIAVALLLSTIVVPVSAARGGNPTIQPQWDNTANIDCTISFDGDVGYAESVVKAQFGSSSIKTDIVVYKQVDSDWIYVTELHDIKYKIVSGVSCTFNAEVGFTYRADYTFTVTKSGVDEVINRTVYKTY